jgi:hypothetical protein
LRPKSRAAILKLPFGLNTLTFFLIIKEILVKRDEIHIQIKSYLLGLKQAQPG